MEEPSAGEREGRSPRMEEPSAGEREGPVPRMRTHPRIFGLIAGSLACVVAGAGMGAEAERTPGEWLRLMDSAFRELDYDGVFSHYTEENAQHTNVLRPSVDTVAGFATRSRTTVRLATFRVVHMVVDGVERERIVYLSGPQREILRTGDQVTCLLRPGDKLLNLEGVLPSGLYGRVFARNFADVRKHYEVTFSARNRVAGRPVVALDVIPNDDDRFGYKLWLDEQTGLLLRSELRDATGSKLEIFKFTTLRIGDQVALADLEPAAEGALMRHLSTTAESTGTSASAATWRPRWVPPGFRMTGADVFQPKNHRGDVNTLRFSDGLAAFSVFIERMPETGAGSVVSRAGATVALTHRTASAAGDHLVTVVGEVPLATAHRIARGVEPSAGEREGLSPRMEEPSAGEREGRSPRMEEPSAGEREGLSPRMKEPSAGEREADAEPSPQHSPVQTAHEVVGDDRPTAQ